MSTPNTLAFQLVEGWEKLPEGFRHLDAVSAAIDTQDRVYLITRDDARVIVYEPDGAFVAAWGEGMFSARTHGIRFGADGSIFTVDDLDHTVRKFTPDGKQLMVLGTPSVGSDTGYDRKLGIASIQRGGPPFNRPTGVAIAPNGEIYVCDGYANARVHRFAADGRLIQSWGEPGTEPGQFNLPHDVWVAADGRVVVADRENDRLQFFSPDGQFLELWAQVQRPTGLYMDRDGLIYVSELWWRVGQRSFVHGVTEQEKPGRVSVFDPKGNLLARWGASSTDRCAPGNFVAPHGIAVDSRGDVYVAEVTRTFAGQFGLAPEDCHTFQKFARVK